MTNWLLFVGIVLVDKRLNLALTQETVATRAGVGYRTVSAYERGYRSKAMKLAVLDRISEALGVPVTEVIAQAKRYAEDAS